MQQTLMTPWSSFAGACRAALKTLEDVDTVATIVLYCGTPAPLVWALAQLDALFEPGLYVAGMVAVAAYRNVALPLLVAAAALGPLAFKSAARRVRPCDDIHWEKRGVAKHASFSGSDVWSFPSGHAAGLTVLACALLRHADATGLDVPRTTINVMWAAGGLARAVLGVHWAGDVVVGWGWGSLLWGLFGHWVV